jgi:hypothetical protein
MIFGKCTYWKGFRYLPLQNVLNSLRWPLMRQFGK